MVENEFPVVLGRDYAGVVEQAGSAATGYAVGDEVFGFLPHASPGVHDGTWAELILVSQDRSVAAGWAASLSSWPPPAPPCSPRACPRHRLPARPRDRRGARPQRRRRRPGA